MGDPVERAWFYYEEGADELVLYDITASPENRGPNLGLIQRDAAEIFIPFAVAGGIRTLLDARAALKTGADNQKIFLMLLRLHLIVIKTRFL